MAKPFTIVVLGCRDTFRTLDVALWKLQRDVSWLHRRAAVYFLDLDTSHGEVSERTIVDEWKLQANLLAQGYRGPDSS